MSGLDAWPWFFSISDLKEVRSAHRVFVTVESALRETAVKHGRGLEWSVFSSTYEELLATSDVSHTPSEVCRAKVDELVLKFVPGLVVDKDGLDELLALGFSARLLAFPVSCLSLEKRDDLDARPESAFDYKVGAHVSVVSALFTVVAELAPEKATVATLDAIYKFAYSKVSGVVADAPFHMTGLVGSDTSVTYMLPLHPAHSPSGHTPGVSITVADTETQRAVCDGLISQTPLGEFVRQNGLHFDNQWTMYDYAWSMLSMKDPVIYVQNPETRCIALWDMSKRVLVDQTPPVACRLEDMLRPLALSIQTEFWALLMRHPVLPEVDDDTLLQFYDLSLYAVNDSDEDSDGDGDRDGDGSKMKKYPMKFGPVVPSLFAKGRFVTAEVKIGEVEEYYWRIVHGPLLLFNVNACGNGHWPAFEKNCVEVRPFLEKIYAATRDRVTADVILPFNAGELPMPGPFRGGSAVYEIVVGISKVLDDCFKNNDPIILIADEGLPYFGRPSSALPPLSSDDYDKAREILLSESHKLFTQKESVFEHPQFVICLLYLVPLVFTKIVMQDPSVNYMAKYMSVLCEDNVYVYVFMKKLFDAIGGVKI